MMLTIKEVAKKLGKSDQAIYKMIRERRSVGKMFYYVPGQGYRYPHDEILEEEK
jgi:excisionase family DNA binding protein